jgi:hypothetical protein
LLGGKLVSTAAGSVEATAKVSYVFEKEKKKEEN